LMPLLTGHGREHHGQILAEASTLADHRRLVPRLHSTTFTLHDVENAYATVESGSGTGRVVVLPNG
jgi:NADPH:quinone reductase